MELNSAGPIDDCGKRFNKVYLFCGVLGAVLGIIFFATGEMDSLFGSLILWIIMGLLVGVIIKTVICQGVKNTLPNWKFSVECKIPYDELVTRLAGILMPLGMAVEVNRDGCPSIKHKGYVYDVSYNEDDTFSIGWEYTLASFFWFGKGISSYRKVSAAMGIIGYNVQQICKGAPHPAEEQ